MDKFPESFERFEDSSDFKDSYDSIQELYTSFGNFQGYYPTYKQRRCLQDYDYLIEEIEEKPEKVRQTTFEAPKQRATVSYIKYKSGRTTIRYRDSKGRFVKLSDS